jgi:hypothetical protein
VLAWLLQLPAGQAPESVLDVLRHDGWLQQLLQCWEADAKQETARGNAPQQQPEAAAAAAAGGSMVGMCQLLLQLLAECCKHAGVADDNVDAEGVNVQAENGSPTSSSSSSGGLLQQLARDLWQVQLCCCCIGQLAENSSCVSRPACGAAACSTTCGAAGMVWLV